MLRTIATNLFSIPNAIIRPVQELGRYALTFAIGMIFKFDKFASLSLEPSPLASRTTYVDPDLGTAEDDVFFDALDFIASPSTDNASMSDTSSSIGQPLKSSLPVTDKEIYSTMSSADMKPNKPKINADNLVRIQKALHKISHERNHKTRMLMTTELLAKTYVYSRPELGSVIEIPSETKAGEMVQYFFTPMNIKNGIPLFILEPVEESSSASPIVIFRGTILSDSSIYADIGVNAVRDGIGKSLFDSAKLRLSYFVKAWTASGKEPIFCGHSLGGCMTQYAAIEFQVGTYHAYNSPRISRSSAEKWDLIEKKPELITVNTKGDMIDRVGSKRIGLVITIDDPEATELKRARALHGNTQLNRYKLNVSNLKNFDKSSVNAYPKAFSQVADTIKAIFAYIFIEPFNAFSEFFAERQLHRSTTVETSPYIIDAFSTEKERKEEAATCNTLLFMTHAKYLIPTDRSTLEDKKLRAKHTVIHMLGVLSTNAPNWYLPPSKSKITRSLSEPVVPKKSDSTGSKEVSYSISDTLLPSLIVPWDIHGSFYLSTSALHDPCH